MNIQPFEDTAILYHSAEDNCWIAHSLRTDQIGTGDDMSRALADLIKGVDHLLEVADEDATIAYLREAPAEIQALQSKSKALPLEIFEVAHKIARGCWPDDIQPGFSSTDEDQAFFARISDCLEPA